MSYFFPIGSQITGYLSPAANSTCQKEFRRSLNGWIDMKTAVILLEFSAATLHIYSIFHFHWQMRLGDVLAV